MGEDEVAADQLLANPSNWRIHPKAQQEALGGVLERVGWVQRVIVNQRTGFVVDGHARAAMAISAEEPVPVLYVDLSEDEERLVLASLDPISAMAGKDEEILASLIGDIELTGVAALDELLGKEPGGGLTDPDDAPEPPEEPVSRLGDLWILGNHRVLCGDSTKAEDVGRCLGRMRPHLMVADPPYGVDYDPAWRVREAEKGNLAYAARRVGEVKNDDRVDWSEAWALFPGAVVYVWSPPGTNCIESGIALRNSGFEIRYMLIWSKSHFPIGRGHYHWRHEPCWYAVRDGKTALWCGDRKQTSVWEATLDNNVEGGHSTQKPVELMLRPMRNHESKEVYDPFCGSGTTIIAAEQMGKSCLALEIEPRYVDVSVRRWQDYTGKQAHNEDGELFDSVAEARRTEAVSAE